MLVTEIVISFENNYFYKLYRIYLQRLDFQMMFLVVQLRDEKVVPMFEIVLRRSYYTHLKQHDVLEQIVLHWIELRRLDVIGRAVGVGN